MFYPADFYVISADNTFDLSSWTAAIINQDDLPFPQSAHWRLTL
jgi:hypothetical protein